MGSGRPAAGGGRWIDVQPERVDRWLTGFADRHGASSVELGPDVVRFRGADDALAECHVPFPPLDAPADSEFTTAVAALAAHTCQDRLVGVVLVRLGGYAVGVFDGDRLTASKVGSRLVHGRNAAGGWSQHRFQRRRDKQVREALQESADVAVRVLRPYLDRLDAVVCGGDKAAVDVLRDDPRLAPVFALEVGSHAGGSQRKGRAGGAQERRRVAGTPERLFLTVPDPKLVVLKDTPRLFRAVRVRLVDPA